MADVERVADRSSGRTTRLLASVSVFALALSAAEPALAQPTAQAAATAQPVGESPTAPDQTAPEATTGKNAIIVTGIRASLRSARDRKKSAEQMVDFDHCAGYWRAARPLGFGGAPAHPWNHSATH